MATTMQNLVIISQMTAELLRFSVFQKGGRPPSWILLQVKSGIMAGCGLSMSTNTPNFVSVSQPAAELLHFVEKFEMVVSAILNLYLAILDHPRSPVMESSHTANLVLIKLLLFIVKTPKRHFLGWKDAIGRSTTRGATGTLSEQYKKTFKRVA